MFKFARCGICERPVLELDGQFEILQPYAVAPDEELQLIAGEVHTKCLVSSELRQDWSRTKLRCGTLQGDEIVEQIDDWTILRDRARQTILALHVDGESIDLPATKCKTSRAPGGVTIELERDYYMQLDDRDLVRELQRELDEAKSVPLAKLVDALALRDTLRWPDVLDTGALTFSRKLLDGWTSWTIGARVTYRRFIPEAVIEGWKRARHTM